MAEALLKALVSNVVVVSGISRQGKILTGFAKFLKKKVVLIMHGCAAYEVVVNEQKNCEAMLEQERYLMEKADLLLPVSKKFRNWVQERYPQYADKTKYLYNGINKSLLVGGESSVKKKGLVIAAGADRVVKNNIKVAQAIEQMNGQAQLEIYGAICHGMEEEFEHAKYLGSIPYAMFMKKLSESELFVQNSLYEPFSLAVVEALMNGASILISENVGVGDLLALEESDLIHDPMNVQEIREKIEYLLEHPNNERILSSLNLDEYSCQKSVERLEQLCRELIAH